MSDDAFDYAALFRGAPVGSVVTGEGDVILQVNDAFLAWTGRRREELVGTSLLRLIPVGDRILFATRVAPLLGLAGRVRDVALTVFDHQRVPLAAWLAASRIESTPPITAYAIGPRRERSIEEAALIGAVHRAELSDARRLDAELTLEQAAAEDSLTGLLNRAGLLSEVRGILEARPAVGEVWLGMLGLDHFRVVNESLGGDAGDEVLRTVAQRLREQLGEQVSIARVGDDEFAVARGGEAGIEGFADEIVRAVARPMVVADLEVVVTASLGAVEVWSGDPRAGFPGTDAESLLRNAATAMHEAKAAGRNRWKPYIAGTAEDDRAIDELRLLGEIRSALAGDELRLEYQPQLDLATGGLHGFEALIRWSHPERGEISPAGFIGVAEKSGLISQLGSWACRTAILLCAELNDAPGSRPVRMAVNISARQFGDAQFAGSIAELLAASGLEPSLLTLEITETGLITDPVAAATNLARLHELGVRLSIDDFGTGHAGFAYLKDFPIDELKIDRSFVSGLADSADDTAIVESCIRLAAAMGIGVVAEGVETAEQQALLGELGCDVVQGFHYSRPLDTRAVRERVAADGATVEPR
ncbi:putative bifunctional diguanylate cyclase/phosphodiesterase [Herbiconiux liangxiaofengii]|uniref:putative bifunctional diguanylate cyclase/phosphodiesterase n=1 Tax=Herbiconiux liangxiaofengii TaxID=3342795 RepID=UPI0035B8C2F7